MARGCIWAPTSEVGIVACYVSKEKGGYGITETPQQLSDAITQYSLTRLSTKPASARHAASKSNYRVEDRQSTQSEVKQIVTTRTSEFSLFGFDIDHLNAKVSLSGTDMIRLTVRDAEAARYEVPVPIQWQPSAPPTRIPAKIKFEMTKTANGQVGFRVRRTNTQTILFDTSFFAEGFIYDDKFIQIITTVPSGNVYGT